MGSFSKNIALFALGFWLGCSLLFAVVVAPMLFNPDVTSGLSREMAGSISGAILRRLYLITYVCSGIAIFFLFLASLRELKGSRGPRRALILCVLILALNSVNDLWIHDRINKVKLAIANTQNNQTETLRKEFDLWHKASRGVYGSAVVFGIIASLFLIPTISPGKSKASSKK